MHVQKTHCSAMVLEITLWYSFGTFEMIYILSPVALKCKGISHYSSNRLHDI